MRQLRELVQRAELLESATLAVYLALLSGAMVLFAVVSLLMVLTQRLNRPNRPAGAGGRIAVYLADRPGGRSVLAAGEGHADPGGLARAVSHLRPFTAAEPGGYVVFRPVTLGGGRLAVITVYVPAADLTRGVGISWAAMTAVAVALVAVSVAVADRLAAQVTGPARRLAA